MLSLPRSTLPRHGLAVGAVVVALAARLALDPVLGDNFPFATLFLAILAVSGFAGRGPALLTTGLGAVVSARYLLPPRGRFAVQGVENQAGMVLYLAVGLGIALLGGAMREARRRAEQNADEARRALEGEHETRELLDSTYRGIGDAVIATDRAGRVRLMNPVAEGLTGWRQGQAVGKPIREVLRILDEQTGRPAESPVDRVLREGVIAGLADPAVAVARDGTRTPIEDSAAPIKDATGAVVGAVMVIQDATERRRHEAAIRESEERHRTILESITDAFCALDRDWRFVYVNRQAAALLGHEREDLLGKDHWQEYPATIGTAIERGYRRAAAEGVAVSFEEFYPPHDRWYEIHAYPSADGLSVYFRDVTARKRVEEERERLMATSEQQRRTFETALSNTPDFNYVFDLEGRFTYVNAALLGLWRIGLDEALGRDFFDLGYPPDLATRLHRQIRQVIDTGQPVRDEAPYASHLGDRQYDYIFVPVQGAGGAVEAVVGSTRDITELKEVEDRLREGEHQFRTLAESIPQLAWMARPDGHIYWYNRRWHEYTGTTPEQMEGWGWRDVHDPDVLPSVMERWTGSIASGEPFDMVFPLKGADGRFRAFLTRVMPVRDEEGRVAHWFGTNTDISDRQRIEEELRAAKDEAESANRAKTQFLAVLSHELRTPLNPILLATSSMLERPCDPEEIRPTLEMIRQNVNLQARLIDDLLDVMRIVRGKMPLHWGVSDCHDLIRHALEICRSEFQGKELDLETDLAAEHHHVNADSARLQQVLWNLFRNAAKFTPSGGRVAIRTYNEPGPDGPEDRIAIEVVDTGIGIEPDLLTRIFEPFQQGESTITRTFGGLGLGLAICKGIVDGHGGTLTAESEGRGRGATFRVAFKTLPEQAVVGADGAPAGGGAEVAPARPSTLRTLVVEDEPATLRLMARLLKGLGHEVTTASTIASGFEAFEAGEFDLIVSDIGLPDGTGLDLMRRVVALRGRVPAIALTGYGMEDDIQKSREAGFATHMTKPIDFTKLEAMIRQVAP